MVTLIYFHSSIITIVLSHDMMLWADTQGVRMILVLPGISMSRRFGTRTRRGFQSRFFNVFFGHVVIDHLCQSNALFTGNGIEKVDSAILLVHKGIADLVHGMVLGSSDRMHKRLFHSLVVLL